MKKTDIAHFQLSTPKPWDFSRNRIKTGEPRMDKSANSNNKFSWTKLAKVMFKLHVLFVEMKLFKKYITLKYSVYIVLYIHLTQKGRFRNWTLVFNIIAGDADSSPYVETHGQLFSESTRGGSRVMVL